MEQGQLLQEDPITEGRGLRMGIVEALSVIVSSLTISQEVGWGDRHVWAEGGATWDRRTGEKEAALVLARDREAEGWIGRRLSLYISRVAPIAR